MNRTTVLAMAMCLSLAGDIMVRAAEMNVNVDAEIKATSAFVWRGRTLNDEPCFQPSMNVGCGNFNLNVWGSWNLTSVSNASLSTRFDTTLDYKFVVGPNIIDPGFSAYIYHDDINGKAKDTYEIFVSYTLDKLLLPSIAVYYDLSRAKSFFVNMSVAHSFNLLKDKIDLDLKLLMDWADKDFNNVLFNYPDIPVTVLPAVDTAGFVDVTAVISMPITLGKNFTITPALKYVTLINSDIRDAVNIAGQDKDIFVYSLTVGAAF